MRRNGWKAHRGKGCLKIVVGIGFVFGVVLTGQVDGLFARSDVTARGDWGAYRILLVEIIPEEVNRMNADSDESGFLSSPANQGSIGEANMLSDGEITLDLYAIDSETGARGHTQLRYPTSHPQYEEILEHLGGLQPGERKPVPPWEKQEE